MKAILMVIVATGLVAGAAHAQSDNSMNNTKAPGTTGAMKTPTAPGVATDPEQVKQQQGDTAKNSAGTVGAAPGASSQSQKPSDPPK